MIEEATREEGALEAVKDAESFSPSLTFDSKAYLLGLATAEGSIQPEAYGFAIKEAELEGRVNEILNRAMIFSLGCWFDEQKAWVHIVSAPEVGATLLTKGRLDREKLLKFLSERHGDGSYASFMAGAWDGDGSAIYSPDIKRRTVSIASTDPFLRECYSSILEKLQISTAIYRHHVRVRPTSHATFGRRITPFMQLTRKREAALSIAAARTTVRPKRPSSELISLVLGLLRREAKPMRLFDIAKIVKIQRHYLTYKIILDLYKMGLVECTPPIHEKRRGVPRLCVSVGT